MHLPSPRAASTLELRPGDLLLVLSDGLYEQHDAQGQMFGEQRVEKIVAAQHGASMAELSAQLLQAVHAFSQGAAQEDDITLVLLRREALG